MCVYVKTQYKIDKNVSYDVDPIKQKWNGFAQHLSAVVVDNTDVAVLTIMSSLKNVSIYTVYYSVAFGITQIIMTTVNGLEAMWGNMLANDEWDQLDNSFSFMEWLIHTVVTIIFVSAALLITPFVQVYTQGITDANYIQPLFGVLLVLAFAIQCYRVPYFRLIKAAGHYRETQNGAFITMFLNISISIILVSKIGLIGVAIGTLIALSFHTCYFALYLSKNIRKRKIKHFIKHIVVNILIASCMGALNMLFKSSLNGYITWIILAVKVTISVTIISAIINRLFYKNYVKRVIVTLTTRIKR